MLNDEVNNTIAFCYGATGKYLCYRHHYRRETKCVTEDCLRIVHTYLTHLYLK